MGLDMYLERSTYIGNKHKKPEEQVKIEIAGVKQARLSSIREQVGYWRKANAIHNWFVDNVQEGSDDCKEYYVDVSQLEELLEIVNKVLKSTVLVEGKVVNGYSFENGKKKENIEDGKVLKDPSVAKELLPTSEGFFFGGTEYDEYYWQDLLDTKKILEEAIAEGGDFYYQSSW